jgi:hypothetical protein
LKGRMIASIFFISPSSLGGRAVEPPAVAAVGDGPDRICRQERAIHMPSGPRLQI